MATQATYKKFRRGQRQASVETNFTSGMMFSEGAVSDGYVKTLVNFDFTQDGRQALKPRAALTVAEFIVPDMVTPLSPSDEELYLDEDTTIKYSKECVENGVDYKQFILGKPDIVDDELQDVGKILVLTAEKSVNDFNDVVTSAFDIASSSSACAFYNTGLTEIHEVELVPDAKTSFPVGTFMGNSFYFFSNSSSGVMKKTVFSIDRYIFDTVAVKTLTASEAVNYGYNMLSTTPYVFADKTSSATFEMNGILPYSSSSTTDLMMSPKANTRVWFRCNYDVATANTYKIVWSWKEASGSDTWTVFNTQTNFKSTSTPVLKADLIVPAKEILIRCEAYRTAGTDPDPDVVEKAMTIGFDFTLDPESTTRNIEGKNYDLSTATGMISWKNRLILWGISEDPTILFISDLDEPGYFPYPNNITVFDEPIVAVTELMDTLVVFTKSKVYQVAQNTDGTSWTSTVIQSNLYIAPWDKHLIQSVRNMVYFKSGNYYYMIVPKAQSTTGELTLAPITTPITDFFNHFKKNVSDICKACFKSFDEDGNIVTHTLEDMVTYYNFIDYENVHNFYVYKSDDTYVHFDIIYNTVSRYWKINVYESAHFLYPFRNDATQSGLMAGTTLIKVLNLDEFGDSDSGDSGDSGESDSPGEPDYINKRIIQLFKFDTLSVHDVYIMAGSVFLYTTSYEEASVDVDNERLIIPVAATLIDDERLYLDDSFVYTLTLPDEQLTLMGIEDYVGGFNRKELYSTMLRDAAILKNIIVFGNRQMLDTGYRDENMFINKRYRELQLQINNLDNVDMEFGMDFQIAGEPRNTDFLYEVSQVIDEMKQDEGIVYIDATPYMPIPYTDEDDVRKGEVDKTNLWTIEHSLDYDISLWKVRASISGKGVAPRLRLFTKSGFNYQLLGINWIYREMNMR